MSDIYEGLMGLGGGLDFSNQQIISLLFSLFYFFLFSFSLFFYSKIPL